MAMARMISKLEGDFHLSSRAAGALTGRYRFDRAKNEVSVEGNVVGVFSWDQISDKPLPVPVESDQARVSITDSEIMAEIQNPDNADAYFVLPSQLNGAEYPSERSIIGQVDDYKFDNTGGPRGQLAAHPAAAQFVLDNAANDKQPNGINAVDGMLDQMVLAGYPFELMNGYLCVPQLTDSVKMQDASNKFKEMSHLLRPLVMEAVPACGLTPDKQRFCEAKHKVNLVYASAIPVQAYMNRVVGNPEQEKFQIAIAQHVLTAQYYGALKTAAEKRPAGAKVFLMPLGGGVFNNPWECIMQGITQAVDMMPKEQLDKLDIRVLTWSGNPGEKQTVQELLRQYKKLRV